MSDHNLRLVYIYTLKHNKFYIAVTHLRQRTVCLICNRYQAAPSSFQLFCQHQVCSVSPDTDNAIVAVLSPFPRNTGVNGSSIANENQPTLLKYLAPLLSYKRRIPHTYKYN